jgi:3-isopropylmalate/(R)-2-methylmalate dehydratase small subunit
MLQREVQKMEIIGTVYKYGDDISTDLLYPGRYTYQLLDSNEMASHALEDLDADFSKKDTSGGIIIAGNNFGCGSAREQAVQAVKAKGIRAIVAKSIARIYYRNCINEGLLPVICPEAAEAAKDGETITIDAGRGIVTTKSGEHKFPPPDKFAMDIISAGGLIASVRKEAAERKKGEST